jgi:hypothetical protein
MRINMRTHALVAVALALTLGVAACGDNDDDTMSASQYRSAGNDICRDADADVSAAIPDEEPTVEAVQNELAAQLSKALSALADRLNALRPPSGLANGHTRLLSTIESATETMNEATQDRAVAQQLVADGPPLDEMAVIAAELGLTACTGE